MEISEKISQSKKIFLPFVLILILLCFVIFCLYHLYSENHSLDYFQDHKQEFVQIAEYLQKNSVFPFSVCDGDLQDLELIDSPDLQNTIRSIMDDGMIFEIRNASDQDTEILFIADDILIRNQETVAIVYTDQIPETEISYKGDSVEYSNQFESLGGNWYRKYRKS
ncbi:MAG: hypothetical protein K2O42_08075 [Oscillospiraceae bacterium]|nr:hypothetical protein [Oscillospiraceae bacterium]